jgi:hypothetical protein
VVENQTMLNNLAKKRENNEIFETIKIVKKDTKFGVFFFIENLPLHISYLDS